MPIIMNAIENEHKNEKARETRPKALNCNAQTDRRQKAWMEERVERKMQQKKRIGKGRKGPKGFLG